MRHEAPKPFNPQFCPGYGEAISAKYQKLCENAPGLTRKLRKRAYRVMSDLIIDDYPEIGWEGTVFGKEPR